MDSSYNIMSSVFYTEFIVVLYFIRPSIVLFSYSAFGCKILLINHFSSKGYLILKWDMYF